MNDRVHEYINNFGNSLRSYKPRTPGLRSLLWINHTAVWSKQPFCRLSMHMPRAHRVDGRIIFRTSGGGNKRRYRLVDTMRRINGGVPARVCRIEHDPCRTSFIALLLYKNNMLSYTIRPSGLRINDSIKNHISKLNGFIRMGDHGLLRHIPVGSSVCNCEMVPGHGATFLRSAGMSGYLVQKMTFLDYAWIRLRGGINRLINLDCSVTVGQVSNKHHRARIYGKAGRSRWHGRRPIVRGVAKNPVDHPHGGGNGKKSNLSVPRTPWGKMLKWNKTSRSIPKKMRVNLP